MSTQDTNKASEAQAEQVKGKLLDAAEALFAENGFERTSVRDITTGAECNVAAVNYYFGNKENLYIEVFRRVMRMLRDIRVNGINQLMSERGSEVTLDELLTVFAELFIKPLVDQSRGGNLMKLWMREIVDHRLGHRMLIEELVQPVTKAILGALLTVCPNLDKGHAAMSVQSMIAQLSHVSCAHEIFVGAGPDELPLLDINRAVEHIVKFSAAGIRAYAKGQA